MKFSNSILMLVIGVALCYKILATNDLNCTIKTDPMENWIALGVMAILFDKVRENIFDNKK